ncbi:MAG: penicillin-binding protein activator LpoB [Planctomycetota bacterium]
MTTNSNEPPGSGCKIEWSRRGWIGAAAVSAFALSSGCASRRYGHMLASDDKDMVGSHEAGAATWNPLVDESVAKLLGRCPPMGQHTAAMGEPFPGQMVSHASGRNLQEAGEENVLGSTATPAQPSPPLATGPARVCFIGIENKSAEEMVDFKDQLYERIDSQINGAASFRSVSRRMIDAALIETRLRPDQLFLPHNRAAFAAALGRHGTPVDYLLYATITSATTDRNHSTQRDYLLALDMVNIHTGDYLKESSKIRKGYHKTRAGKWWNFGWFDQADG